MQLLSYFLRKYRFFLFFLLLEIVALSLIIQNHSFHRSKFVNSANAITGGIYSKMAGLEAYFSLSEENEALIEENLRLKQWVIDRQEVQDLSSDSISLEDSMSSKYVVRKAIIVKNSFRSNYNFLLINAGTKDSVQPEMGVVNEKGILGITENSSKHYTRIQSILNLESIINAKFKHNDYYGSLTWNGKDYNIVQLIDVERQAPVKLGDTVVTGGRSAIFPAGIPIGTVIKKNQNSTITSSIDIRLFNDMSSLRNVYLIENKHQQELKKIETQDE